MYCGLAFESCCVVCMLVNLTVTCYHTQKTEDNIKVKGLGVLRDGIIHSSFQV